jgi:GntR family transcriptional regulator / MocR family aminotransferase
MMGELQTHFSQWLEPIPSSGGLHLTALLREPVDLDAIVRNARQRNLDVRSLRGYSANGDGQEGLVLGYGATDARAIAEGLLELRRLFPASTPSRVTRSSPPLVAAPR